jgi:hypothetical protein
VAEPIQDTAVVVVVMAVAEPIQDTAVVVADIMVVVADTIVKF